MTTDLDPVVCFAGDDYWHSNPHSRYHLMHALHRQGRRVLWVNSIGMNLPKARRRGFVRKVMQRLRSWSRWLREAEPGFWVLTPIALPLFGNRLIEALNERWVLVQVRAAYRRLGLRRPLVLAAIPSFAGVVARLPRAGLIYYYSDKYDAYRDITARGAIQARDRQLFTSADAVFCASQRVHESLCNERPHVHYLPHAVDFVHFNGALARDLPEPADLAAVPRPRIGYFGSLTDSNDLELIRHAATADPSLQFVLIGRVFGDYSAIETLPNVHLLGFKPYAELPLYGRRFDVAFMSWKLTDWIRHSNPLKTKEYLSLGLPVVSVPIDEVIREYGDLVRIAGTGAEFLAAIRAALADDSPELRRRRVERVRGESWDARTEQMLHLYEESRRVG